MSEDPRGHPDNLDLSPDMFRSRDEVQTETTELPIQTKTQGQLFIPVTYEIRGGYAVYEDDIVLGKLDEIRARARGIGRVGQRFRWKEDTIPFITEEAIRDRVLLAIYHWEAETPFYFEELSAPPEQPNVDYLHFHAHEDANNSMVGRQGGRQVINIKTVGGTAGNVIHEIGHALGLWHEQSRHDRDEHIQIRWENIKGGQNNHNFKKKINDGFDIGEYDFKSIMHYPKKAFTANGEDTIVTQNGESIGQRDGLSPGDINAIKTLYPDLDWTVTGALKRRKKMSPQSTETEKQALEKELELIELQKKIATAQQEIAKAEKGTIDAQLPSGTTKPMEGKITTDKDSGFMAELAAYNAMLKLADQIATEINGINLGANPVILLTETLDLVSGSAASYQLEMQVKTWTSKLAEQKKAVKAAIAALPGGPAAEEDIALAVATVSGLLSAAADIAGFFQVSYDIKGRKIEGSDLALRLRLAQKITAASVRLPAFYYLDKDQAKLPEILGDVRGLLDARDLLARDLADLQARTKNSQDKAVAGLIAATDQQLKSFDAFFTTITTAAGDKPSPLVQAVLQSDLIKKDVSHLLYLTITSAGGDAIAGQGLFQTGKMAYLGGGIVSYVFARIDGTIQAAGSLGGSASIRFNLRDNNPPVLPAWDTSK